MNAFYKMGLNFKTYIAFLGRGVLSPLHSAALFVI